MVSAWKAVSISQPNCFNPRNMKTRKNLVFVPKSIYLPVLLFFILFNGFSYAQTVIDNSGIIHTTASGEEFNLISIKIDKDVTNDNLSIISTEINKYEDIYGMDADVETDHLHFKHNDNMTPNQILAILQRINFAGHYKDGATDVYYVKDENIYFIR